MKLAMKQMADGTGFHISGQVFRQTGTRQVVRKDGEWTTVVEWSSHCAACGDVFATSTPVQFKWPTRRCQSCKHPGKRVAA